MIKIVPIEFGSFKLMPYRILDNGYVMRLHNRAGSFIYDDDVYNLRDDRVHLARIKTSIETNTVCWICWEKELMLRFGMLYFTDIVVNVNAVFHPVIDREGYRSYISRNNHINKESPMFEVSKVAIKYMFQVLNLQRVSGSFFMYNLSAINLCKRLGFKEEGVVRKGARVNEQPVDVKILGLLREEVKW